MYRVLVADDDAGFRSAVSNVLRIMGMEVLMAPDGRMAMDLLRDNQVDLTIVDIFMPNVDGMEFIIRVKRDYPEAKIIAVSGGGEYEMKNVLEIAEACGAERTLMKPFEIADLVRAVNDVLELHHANSPAKRHGGLGGECSQ